jgi:hypothetical protein
VLSYYSQKDAFVLHNLKLNLTFRNLATSTAEQIYVPTLGRDITCTCRNKMPFLQGGPFFSSEDLCECPLVLCVCRLGVGVELNWSFALSLSATSPTGNDSSFHRHPRRFTVDTGQEQ